MKRVYLTVTPHYGIEEGSLYETIELAKKSIENEARDTVHKNDTTLTGRYGSREDYINTSSVMSVEVTEEEWDAFKAIMEDQGNRFDILQTVAKRTHPKPL